MRIVNFDKDTYRFTIHWTDEMDQSHIDILKRFLPNDKFDRPTFNYDEIFTKSPLTDEDGWQVDHRAYFDLQQWGFLETKTDHHLKREFIQLSELGKLILDKIVGKPIKKGKDVDTTP